MKARQSVHLANANVCDADGNASPQEPHVGAHKKQEHRCGADARLSVSHVSLPYGRLLLLTFEMFSSLLPCSLYSCLFHSHKHTHTHRPAASQYFVIKRHCISSSDQADGAA